MNIKKYLADRKGYILVYFLSSFFIILIMQLDLILKKERVNLSHILYSLLLSTFFCILFLLYDYSQKKAFYKELNTILKQDHSIQCLFHFSDHTNHEHQIFQEILFKNYNAYESILDEYRKKHKQHLYFINRWVHQMKTPLSIINLSLQNDSYGTMKEMKKTYENIREETEKMAHGLEMALYTARINDFELDFKVEVLDIVQLIRKIINENKKVFIKHRIYPKVNTSEDIKVNTDYKWIVFVIHQIISNAIKYSIIDNKTGKKIIFRIIEQKKGAELVISDEGVGIPKQDLSRIFDPFFTGINGRSTSESTGMGMYLSKVICDKLGHDLEVQSIRGKGTTVRIFFFKGKSLYNLSE